MNCDVDDIFKCLCSNQLTFLQMRRSTSCGRQKFRKKVMFFYSILDHNFYSLTEVMLYKRLVSKKRCCTRKPRYKVCRWRDVECFVICGLPSPPTFIYLHELNSDYFPIRGLLFQIKLLDKYQVLSHQKVILVEQDSPISKISISLSTPKSISKTHPNPR